MYTIIDCINAAKAGKEVIINAGKVEIKERA